MSETHERMEARLGRMIPEVNHWWQHAQDAPPVEGGSDFANDDVPYLRVSLLAWHSAFVAAEHLHFALTAMRMTRTLYPSANMTSLRTALLASSHAVWVLAPDLREDRQERAMRLQSNDLRDQMAMVRDLATLPDDQAAVRDEELSRLGARLTMHKTVAETLGLRDAATSRMSDTDVIAWAAKHVHADDESDLVHASQLLWRFGSSAAHGQRSFALRRLDTSSKRAAGADTVMTYAGDLASDVVPAASASLATIREAFRLFALRNTTPAASSR
jgi:hypothetical protein